MGHDPHTLMFLGISVATLLVGPGIHHLAQREPVTMAALDNFVLVTIVGLVVLEIVPDALELAGLPALLALLLGALAPALADGPLHRAAAGTRRTALLLAVLGMALHSFTDGLALASAHLAGGRSHALEVAIVAHQLPVAVAVWWLLSPAGLLRASAAMLLLGLATVLGFVFADASLEALAPAWLGLLQGLFAGLLLHVVAHRTHTAAPGRRARVAAALGGLAGLGLLAVLVRDAGHGHDADPLSRMLLAAEQLARASAPALLLGLLLLGLLAAWAPTPRALARTPTVHGLVFGLLRPFRAHERLAALHELERGGAPARARLAYLVAAPTLGVEALLVSVPLLGGAMTLARGLAAVALALVVGRVAGGLADRGPEPAVLTHDPHDPPHDRHDRHDRLHRLLLAIDGALPWLVFGLVFAAMLAPWLSPTTLRTIPLWLQIPLFAALGVPARLCAAAATPVIAVLLAAGLSPGAGLAFLLTASATSLASQGLLTRRHGPQVARLNLVLIVGLALALGLTLDLVHAPVLPLVLDPAAHDPGAAGLGNDLALAALIVLTLASLLRQTPQQFLRRLWVRHEAARGPTPPHDPGHAHFSSRGPHGS